MVTLTWPQIIWASGIFLAWNGFLLAIIKWLLARVISNIESKIEGLAKSMCSPERCDELKRVSKEMTDTRVELPMLYFRREDAIRENTVAQARIEQIAMAQQQFVLRDDLIRDMTVIHAKFDTLSDRVQRVLEGRKANEDR